MSKTEIYENILSAVTNETEVTKAQILSHSKQSDVVEARCLLFHYLHRAGFYPSQIARITNQSRQCVNCLLLSFQARCDYSGNMLKRYVKKLDVGCRNISYPLNRLSNNNQRAYRKVCSFFGYDLSKILQQADN